MTDKTHDPAAEAAALHEPGPTDYRGRGLWIEARRAAVWLGMALAIVLIVLLIQPILFIIGAVVIATMLDGGARLLGRVLPIPRGWRLTVVILAVVAFLSWTFFLTGRELTAQAGALPGLVEAQVNRITAWLSANGIRIGQADFKSVANQLMGSLGSVTAWVGSAIGIVSSVAMMLVLAIFLAVEPTVYARGLAWMFPIERRPEVLDLSEKMGSTLRRLMGGRLLGMTVEGVGVWLMLMIGGVPMAALLGVLTGILAFLPNIGAIISGGLVILVGFSAGWNTGLYAVGVYVAVQVIDGYLIVPMVARRAVDLPPALVLGAQILFGALFGILGLALADPIVAMVKVMLETQAEDRAEETENPA